MQAAVLRNPEVITAHRLLDMDTAGLRQLVGCDLPLPEERARLLREVG